MFCVFEEYQLVLFLVTRSIFLVRTCWNVKQPAFGYALACLTESHAVVFGTHPGRARYRVILPQFRVTYLLLLRERVLTTIVFKTYRKTHVSLVFFTS